MRNYILHSFGRVVTLATTATMLGACAADTPVQPLATTQPAFAAQSATGLDATIATLRAATGRYHNLDNAKRDGFVLLHECEVREEGPVGTVYVHMDRLLDGVVDPQLPDALVYAPSPSNGRLQLVGVEFAVPYALWTDPQPPQFEGVSFQREDEFGVFALHAWVWLKNPNGMFEETNPRISCAS